MADYYATARSNYFRVRDPKLFEFAMDELSISYDKMDDENGDSHFCINGDDCHGTFPSQVCGCGIDVEITHPDFSGTIFISDDEENIYDKAIEAGHKFDDEDPRQHEALVKHINDFFTAKVQKLLPGAEITIHNDLDELDGEDDNEYDLGHVVSQHLPEGTVAIFREIGAEKMRYLGGCSFAVSHTGEQIFINLDAIYERASEKFGVDIAAIPRCEYRNHIVDGKVKN